MGNKYTGGGGVYFTGEASYGSMIRIFVCSVGHVSSVLCLETVGEELLSASGNTVVVYPSFELVVSTLHTLVQRCSQIFLHHPFLLPPPPPPLPLSLQKEPQPYQCTVKSKLKGSISALAALPQNRLILGGTEGGQLLIMS